MLPRSGIWQVALSCHIWPESVISKLQPVAISSADEQFLGEELFRRPENPLDPGRFFLGRSFPSARRSFRVIPAGSVSPQLGKQAGIDVAAADYSDVDCRLRQLYGVKKK